MKIYTIVSTLDNTPMFITTNALNDILYGFELEEDANNFLEVIIEKYDTRPSTVKVGTYQLEEFNSFFKYVKGLKCVVFDKNMVYNITNLRG